MTKLHFFFFFLPCSLGNSSEKLGRYWALTVWKESAPSPPLCFPFDLKYPSVTVFCKPIIHLWLLKTLFPGMEFARGSQSLQLPEIGAFPAFAQPELSAWKGAVAPRWNVKTSRACLKHQRNSTKPVHSRFYSFPKPECLSRVIKPGLKQRNRLVWACVCTYIYVERFSFLCVQTRREEQELKCSVAGMCAPAALTWLCAHSPVPWSHLL